MNELRHYAEAIVHDESPSNGGESDRRLPALTAWYQIFRLAQAQRSLSGFMEHVAAFTLQAMETPAGARCTVTVGEQRAIVGDAGAVGQRIASMVSDTSGQHGEVQVTLAAGVPVGSQDQPSVEATAQAITLWLRSERDRREIEMFRCMVSSTSDCVALISPDLHYRIVNPAYAAHLGKQPEEFRGRPVTSVLPEDLVERDIERLRSALDGESLRFRERREHDGKSRQMTFSYSPFFENGQVLGVIVSGQDITDLDNAQARLLRAAKVFSSAREAIFTTDLDGVITDVNPAFCEITGYGREQALGERASMLSCGRHDKATFEWISRRVALDGEWRGEIWNRRPDGEVYPCKLTMSTVVEADEPSGFVAVFSDVTQQKHYEKRLEVLANHDTLTGLPNRAQLARQLERSIELAKRACDGFSLMFVDLDRFKEVNDSLGHAAGDMLLCAATLRLKSVLRANDLLARVGGDEFVVVLPGMQGRGNASVVADKILQSLSEPFDLEGMAVSIGASIGLCCYPDDGDSADLLLRHADVAMYQAKQSGRGRWRCFAPDMTNRATRDFLVLDGLRKALDLGELRLVYQPQFDLASGGLRAVEALLRCPTLEQLSDDTGEVIRIAEHGGVVSELDHWVMRKACAQLTRWREEGQPQLRMIVNVSGLSLQRMDFAHWIERCMKRHELPGQALELQVREDVLHQDQKALTQNLRRLADLDVGLSIDGFGTAYSSLMTLDSSHVSRISIDASFTQGLDRESTVRRVVEAIVALAESLGLGVVAQGLETDGQVHFFKRFAGLQGQGFHLQPPLAASELESLCFR